ncbi:CD82 antigen [Sebastes umbrosus]|uniref:CD82 antigen n=1 Tax=Sebastes umbrosus TaxID=72105 RepID=UPI00189F17C5|nr:CD82 antigen [Sebastes umbrosus]XP_037639592.1 CD82 antigen [Sebastes umbrosus]
MKLDVKIQLLKFCFQVVNFIFLALGVSVSGIGLWILFDRGNLLTVLPDRPPDELRVVGAGLMLIGVVVLAVSVVGILGADKENRVLLLVYLGFLIVLVLGQLFVTLLLLLNKDKIERGLDQTVDQIILQYRDNNSNDRLMDKIQNYEGCCGRTGPADWLMNSYIQSLNLSAPDVLPCSCFRSHRPAVNSPWCSELLNFTAPLYGRGNGSYAQGCKQKVSDWLQENFLTIVSMDVGLMLIQAVQFVITVYLYRAFGRKAALKRADRLADPEEDLDYGEQNYAYADPDYAYVDPAHPAHHHDYPESVDPTQLAAYHHDNQNYN